MTADPDKGSAPADPVLVLTGGRMEVQAAGSETAGDVITRASSN
ncbi:hypothetical protein AB0J40_22825 [Amycolatopsis sp. NPDC049691]